MFSQIMGVRHLATASVPTEMHQYSDHWQHLPTIWIWLLLYRQITLSRCFCEQNGCRVYRLAV